MLSVRDNFLELMNRGHPDRYVNQWEYMRLIQDPACVASTNVQPPGTLSYKDGWGVEYTHPINACARHPVHTPGNIAITDIEKWKEQIKPSPTKFPKEAWEACIAETKRVEKEEDCFTADFMLPGIFERIHYLMGMENALVSFAVYPDEMKELIDYILNWELECMEQRMDICPAEIMFHHDDWGTSNNSFFEVDDFRDFFLQPYKTLYGNFKKLGGKFVVHHSDGVIPNLVPTMIDIGIDVWQAVSDKNKIEDLTKQYGDKILFQGGIDDGIVDIADWQEDKVRAFVRSQCQKIGTYSWIPSVTRGSAGTLYPGVDEVITDEINKMSKELF